MRKLLSVLTSVMTALLEAAEWAFFLPFRAIGNFFGGLGDGRRQKANAVGKQASQAAADAEQQVADTSAAVDNAMLLHQRATVMQRAAAFKVRGHDYESAFANVMPPKDLHHVRRLTHDECQILSRTDSRIVAGMLEGSIARIPGVRTLDELAAEAIRARDAAVARQPAVSSPAPVATSDEEQAVLTRLSQRLQAIGRRPRAVDDPGLEFSASATV